MTTKTSQNLANILRKAGFVELAIRAEQDEFHDFYSPHALPETKLDEELVAIITSDTSSAEVKAVATDIRQRHHDGEFDASVEESDEWAASEDAQTDFQKLLKDIQHK